MKNYLVVLFAVFVAVVSAARLPETNSRISLDKLEPVLKNFIDHMREIKSKTDSEDVFENQGIPEVSQPEEVDDSLEEFRQKPMNWKALMEKLEKQLQNAAKKSDNEDSEDSDVVLSYGLDEPVKINKVKDEIDDDEEDEAIDMAKEDKPDVQISYGLAEPIKASEMKKNIIAEEEDDEDDDEENQSIIPTNDIKDEDKEEIDDEDVQVSFGLAEPIDAVAAKKFNQQDAEDDEDDEEEDDKKPSDLNEKVMSEVIRNVLQKFAEAYNLKL